MEHQASLTHSDPMQEALQLLLDSRVKILALLQQTHYTNLQVSVDNNLNQLIHFFRHTTGAADTTLGNDSTISFGPLSSFMGEPVHAPTAIDVTLLTPSVEERELLKQKVLQLEASIENSDNDVVINSYALPEDELVLRGLAKKLEITGYETSPIDYDFINAIRAAVVTNKPIEQKEHMLNHAIADKDDLVSKKPASTKSKKKLSE